MLGTCGSGNIKINTKVNTKKLITNDAVTVMDKVDTRLNKSDESVVSNVVLKIDRKNYMQNDFKKKKL